MTPPFAVSGLPLLHLMSLLRSMSAFLGPQSFLGWLLKTFRSLFLTDTYTDVIGTYKYMG